MLDIIDSIYTRNRYEEIDFQLSDFQKATLLWNKPNTTRQERLSALNELAIATDDISLKLQITQRLAYEEKAIKQFETEVYGETLYVVFDSEDNSPCGYFEKYETAFTYAENRIKKEEAQYVIEKHKIVTGGTVPLVKPSYRINPNLITKKPDKLVEYSGLPIACMYFDKNANVIKLWSNELDDTENSKVDEYRKERFEYQFLALPYVHYEGMSVRYIPTGEYGIVETTMDEWICFLERVEKGLYVDFSDTAITVYFLTENGYWSHQHCNPIYLEAETPEMTVNDKKQCAFCRAIAAMSDYMGGHKDKAQELLVLKTASEYAIICEKPNAIKQGVQNAKQINDILL